MVPLEQRAVQWGGPRDGSKASKVVKAPRQYGWVGKGCRRKPAQLEEMPLPLIVFWNFNHFLVVEGFSKDKVYLNDPAVGPRSVSREEFDQSFTGVVLALEVGPEFQKGGKNRSLLEALGKRIAGLQGAVFYIVLTG